MSLVTGGRTVTGLHAEFKRVEACAVGSAEVKGTLKLKIVTVGHGIPEWAVAGGRNSSGGLSAIPVVFGHVRLSAKPTCVFNLCRHARDIDSIAHKSLGAPLDDIGVIALRSQHNQTRQ